jgi:flagellar hook-length control protein FliK
MDGAALAAQGLAEEGPSSHVRPMTPVQATFAPPPSSETRNSAPVAQTPLTAADPVDVAEAGTVDTPGQPVGAPVIVQPDAPLRAAMPEPAVAALTRKPEAAAGGPRTETKTEAKPATEPTRGERRRAAAERSGDPAAGLDGKLFKPLPDTASPVAESATATRGASPKGEGQANPAQAALVRAEAPLPATAGLSGPPPEAFRTEAPPQTQGASPLPVRLTPAAASADTVASLAASIVRRLEGRSTRFDVELHPAELGAVQVRLEIARDGQVQAQLAFDNPMAAADLRARADELRRMLEQAGFQLSQDALSFEHREPGSGFAGREGGREGRSAAGARAFQNGAGLMAGAEPPPLSPRLLGVRTGVDIRI